MDTIENQPTPPEPDPILGTPMEARRLLFGDRISRNGFYEAMRRGDVPSIRIGRRLFVPMAEAKRKLGSQQ